MPSGRLAADQVEHLWLKDDRWLICVPGPRAFGFAVDLGAGQAELELAVVAAEVFFVFALLLGADVGDPAFLHGTGADHHLEFR